jgi:VanZ family protein
VTVAPLTPRDGLWTSGSRRWIVPLLILVAILTATSWPTPPAMPHDSDKLVHCIAYAALGAAVAWAARSRAWREVMVWLVLVAATGAADEWHQQFIPGRRMDARDWVADTIGAAIGISLLTALTRRPEHRA